MAFNLKMQLKISKVAIYFMLVSLFAIAEETFIEIPISQTVSIGETAEFRCRHSTADIIRWRVNGSLVSISKHPVDITPGSVIEGDVSVSILTITGRPEYNGTEVFCVANFDDGTPEETTSSAAVLRVINNYTPTITTTKTTTIPDVQLTATELATTSGSTEPTLNPIGNFEITPSPLTVAVEQEVATFYCQCLSCDIITWLVNGTLVTKINSSNINITVTFIIRNMMYTLSIGTLLEYSGTTVECVAIFFHGSPPMHSPPVTLLIQDTPGEVENFTSERNSLSSLLTTRWSSLASLDLNDTDPDIVYSVELYKITCGEDIFMSHEDVFVNSTTNTVDPMEIYKVIITARNNVQGARNGTRVEIREVFMTLNKDKLFQLTRNSQFNTRDESPVPSYYTMILEPLDGHQEQNLMINSSVERSGEMVNISVDGEIPTKTLWNASLLAYGCQSDTVVKEVELSTHDIQNISVTSPQPGEVRVTGDFIDGSTATGLLIIIYSLTNDSDVHYITGGTTSQQPRNVHVSVPGLAGGNYSMSLFVVEENGLPFERVATLPKVETVESHEREGLVVEAYLEPINHSLQSTSTGVCITCTFLDSSATDCVAVVHQRISQLNSSGLMNIESSHKLNRSGDTASGCIEGVNMEDYQVGVFEWRQPPSIKDNKESGAASSCQGCIVGTVLGVLVFILLAVVAVAGVVSLVVVRKRKRTKSHDIERRGPPVLPLYDHVNQTENEATVQYMYESIPLTNSRESRTELEEVSEPLLSTRPPLPTRPGENRVHSDGSSDSARSSEDTIETELSSPAESNDDRVLGDPGPLYDLPQLPGSSVVPPPTDIQHQSNEEESPPPVPLRTEDSKVLVEQSSNPSPSAQDTTSINIQSSPIPMYAEPQMTGRAPVQTPSNEDQALQSPPPVPPITEDREVLLQGSSGSSPTQDSPHIAVSIDQPPSADSTYAGPQSPAVKQPQSKEKQVSPKGESCGPTYAQPVLSTTSGVISPPPATEPVVYEDVKGFNNSEGQHYAMLGDMNTSKKTCTPDDSDQEKTVYSEIEPRSLVPTTAAVRVEPNTSSEKNRANTDPPFTVEYIFPTLLFMASKWEALGEALSLDEDRLDEIFTNNETDEACLRVMLEHYMERSDLKHNWEEVREAMRKVEEGGGETEELDSTSMRSQEKDLIKDSDEIDEVHVVASELEKNHPTDAVVPLQVPPHHPTDVHNIISMDIESSTGHAPTSESAYEKYPSNCGGSHIEGWQPYKHNNDVIIGIGMVDVLNNNNKQGQSSEEDDVEIAEEQTGKQANDEVVNEHDVQSQSSTISHQIPCEEELNVGPAEIEAHSNDDDDDSFASIQHVPYEEKSDDHHVKFIPNVDNQGDNSDSNEPKGIHTNDPQRSNEDQFEYSPQYYPPPEISPQLFSGIKEGQTKEHHHPLTACQVHPCVLNSPKEKSSGHNIEPYVNKISSTPLSFALETCPQPFSGDKNIDEQYSSTKCQEPDDDEADYENEIRKLLNIEALKEPKRGGDSSPLNLSSLCIRTDMQPSIHKQRSTHKTSLSQLLCPDHEELMTMERILRDIVHSNLKNSKPFVSMSLSVHLDMYSLKNFSYALVFSDLYSRVSPNAVW